MSKINGQWPFFGVFSLFWATCFPFAAISENDTKTWELTLSDAIKHQETCELALAHFSRYCKIFSGEWKKTSPHDAAWERNQIRYAWFDFDADGFLDIYIRNESSGWCGSAGCENIIIFNDLATGSLADNYRGTAIAHSMDPVFLHIDSKKRIHIRYGEHERLFDIIRSKDENFIRLDYKK